MPVIVVGADTVIGRRIVDALAERPGEIRAFVSDPAVAAQLRRRGVKTALGDVSDGAHVGAAAFGCFGVVLVGEAARDERERSFAATPREVFAAWAEGIVDAAPTRAIWVGVPPDAVPELPTVAEVAVVEPRPDPEETVAEVRRLDEAARW